MWDEGDSLEKILRIKGLSEIELKERKNEGKDWNKESGNILFRNVLQGLKITAKQIFN